MSNFNNFTFKINILGWWGAFPQPGGATCGVLVTTSEGKFLLDCGGGVLSKYFEHANLTDQFQGVLLSHLKQNRSPLLLSVPVLRYQLCIACRSSFQQATGLCAKDSGNHVGCSTISILRYPHTGRRHEDTYGRRRHYRQESQSYDRMLCIPH